MPEYPIPNRSNFRPNQLVDDEVPQGDLGAVSGTLSDGRSYLCESWFSEGVTLVTFIFSVQGLEAASAERLCALLQPKLASEAVLEEYRRLSESEKHKILDANQNEMYSLSFVVGMPEF